MSEANFYKLKIQKGMFSKQLNSTVISSNTHILYSKILKKENEPTLTKININENKLEIEQTFNENDDNRFFEEDELLEKKYANDSLIELSRTNKSPIRDPNLNLQKNNNTPPNSELIKKFNFLAHEMSKTYLDNTKQLNSKLDLNISQLVKLAESKIVSKCENEFKQILSVSDPQPIINEKTDQVLHTLKPKSGKEEEYNLYYSKFNECARPYVFLTEQVYEYRHTFRQLNNHAYSFCMKECEDDLVKKKEEGKINFDRVKYCLKDCYNLGTFNFKAYFDFVSEGVKINTEQMDKL